MIKAPKKTSIWRNEPKHKKYVLYFAPELINFIKEKQKYKTYRFGDHYDYIQVGDKVKIQETNKENVVANAVITNKEYTTFKNLPLNINGHETYKDKEQERKVLSGYYKFIGRDIRDNDKFLILTFELI